MGVLPLEAVNHFLVHIDQQILNIIGKAYNKFALNEFDLCHLAFTGKLRHPGLDVRQCDRFDCLTESHTRFHDMLAIWHVECVPQ